MPGCGITFIYMTTATKSVQIPKVGIIMGSDSDFDIMKEAVTVLDEFKYNIRNLCHFSTPHTPRP